MCEECTRAIARQRVSSIGFSVVPITFADSCAADAVEEAAGYWWSAVALVSSKSASSSPSDKHDYSHVFALFDAMAFLLRVRYFSLDVEEPLKSVVSKLPSLTSLKESGPYRRQYEAVAKCLLAREIVGLCGHVLKDQSELPGAVLCSHFSLLEGGWLSPKDDSFRFSFTYAQAVVTFAQARSLAASLVKPLIPADIELPTGHGPFAIWTNDNRRFKAVSIQMVNSGEDFRSFS